MKEYNALYTYFVRDFEKGIYNKLTARCIVIGETIKSYRIKLIDVIQRRLPGECLWVRKKSVFRSMKNNESGKCDKYNIVVSDENCRACLYGCLEKTNMTNKGKRLDL